MTLIPLLLGCLGEVPIGHTTVCLDGGRPSAGEDVDLDLSGTVTAVGEDAGDCATAITVDDGAGTVATIGLTVLDPDDGDATPAIDLAVGDAVTLRYRYRLVWGDVAGFVLTDAAGLVAAAEEGAWGGALEEGDVPGLSVHRGDDVVVTERTDCQPREGYEVVFEDDETVVVEPFGTAEVAVGGVPLTATAVAAWDYGESRTCQIMDATGFTSWVVTRP